MDAGTFPEGWGVMPFSYQISRVTRRACMRAEGAVDLTTSLEAGYRLATDGRIGQGFRVLIDLRGSSWNPSSDEAMDLATAVAQLPLRDSKVALLVGQGGRSPAKIFCDLASAHGFAVQVFETCDEAHDWLAESRPTH